MDGKGLLTSKIFWANVVSLAAVVAGYLPPQYAAVILPVLNVMLRIVTDKPITGIFTKVF